MKSTLITLKNQKFNAEILNTLIFTLDSEISVVSATHKTLKSTIKRATLNSAKVFIVNEFLTPDFLQTHNTLFDDNSIISDENGRIIALYSIIRTAQVAVLPQSPEAVRSLICKYFNKKSADKAATHTSIYLATTETDYIKKTLCEFYNNRNFSISINKFDLYSEIQLTVFAETLPKAEELLSTTKEKILMLLGDDVYSVTDCKIEKAVVELLLKKEMKLATAESCTGGLLSQKITSVPNSSSVFEIGITSYSNRIKQYALSVPKETLNNYGAVSKQTAALMALGVKNISGADLGVGITGVAGPSSSEGKPVGTVYVALTDGLHHWVISLNLFPFSTREEIRNIAVFTALDLVRRYIECSPAILPEYSSEIDDLRCIYEQPHFINSSLLFMKNSLSDYLNNQEEQEEVETTNNILTTFKQSSVNSSPLNKLRKKVIKKHRVKVNFKFKLPKINFSIKDYFNRLLGATDIKGVLLNTLLKITTLILVSTIIMVTIIASNNFLDDHSEKVLLRDLQKNWSICEVSTPEGVYYDFNNLKMTNPDISAWLSIKNTSINYPVCDYNVDFSYNKHNYKKDVSDYGAIHFDSQFDGENLKVNTVINGKNLQNDTMFSILSNYRDKEFANSSQLITLTTANKKRTFEVFAVLLLTDNPEHEKENNFFDYTKTTFTSDYQFTLWLSEARLRSFYKCNLTVNYGDNLLTLVTDSFEFSSAKTVIIARETNEYTVIGANPLTVNPSPKLPKIWYAVNGIKNPYDYSSNYTFQTIN